MRPSSIGDIVGVQGPCGPVKALDDVLEEIPMGKFHFFIFFLAGLAFCTDAMEVVLLGFISPCAGADWDLSNEEMASLVSVVFVGQILGSLLLGPIADALGRRTGYLIVGVLISTGGWLSGMAPNYGLLLTFQFIVGVGIGGAFIPYDILAEFLPASQRGIQLMAIMAFWTAGGLFVSAMAAIVLPTHGWHVLIFTTCVPVTIASLVSYVYVNYAIVMLYV